MPKGLVSTFPAVVSVTLAGNKMTSLANGDLSAMKNVVLVDVSRNEIQTIASGSLPGDKIQSYKVEWPNNRYENRNIIVMKFDFPIFLFDAALYASGGSVMKLDSNKLTSLDAAVFQPIVSGFIANGYSSANTFISVANSNLLPLSLDYRRTDFLKSDDELIT